MKKYEILPHTADLKIKVFGETKEELFLNALLAMSECLKPDVKQKIKKGAAIKREISIKSADLSALLVDFLSEALYLSQVNKESYNDLKINNFSDTQINGELSGFSIERFGEDIKAATYHNLDISQKDDSTWEAVILFDI